MNKCIISAIVMFVMAFVLSYFVHGVLLYSDYMQMQSWMRPQAEVQSLMAYMILAQALFGIAFAWIYVQGRDGKPWLGQGVRFGIAVADAQRELERPPRVGQRQRAVDVRLTRGGDAEELGAQRRVAVRLGDRAQILDRFVCVVVGGQARERVDVHAADGQRSRGRDGRRIVGHSRWRKRLRRRRERFRGRA